MECLRHFEKKLDHRKPFRNWLKKVVVISMPGALAPLDTLGPLQYEDTVFPIYGFLYLIISYLYNENPPTWEETVCILHDDVIKWKHFPRNWPFVWGIHRSPVNSPHKDQWRGALMFSLICAWINGWANNREAGDLRRHRTHYDVTVLGKSLGSMQPQVVMLGVCRCVVRTIDCFRFNLFILLIYRG